MTKIFDKYCCYCGKSLPYTSFDFTKEHLVPKSKGGNNSIENKKPCCKICNGWRGNQTLSQFKTIVQFHINNNLEHKGLTKYDFEIIIQNIDYWDEYVKTSNNKLKL